MKRRKGILDVSKIIIFINSSYEKNNMVFNFKKLFGVDAEEEYVEIDLDSVKPKESKVLVKPFVLRTYENIEEILNALREGYTIAIIDIKPLKTVFSLATR